MFEDIIEKENAVLRSTSTGVDGERIDVYFCYDEDGVFTKLMTITLGDTIASLRYSDFAAIPRNTFNDRVGKALPKWSKSKKCPICGDEFSESLFQKVKGRYLCIPNKCYLEVREK